MVTIVKKLHVSVQQTPIFLLSIGERFRTAHYTKSSLAKERLFGVSWK